MYNKFKVIIHTHTHTHKHTHNHTHLPILVYGALYR